MNDKGEGQSQEPAGAEAQGVEITPRPDYQVAFPTFYANFASVSHTSADICLDFCVFAPPYNLDRERGILKAPVIARLIVTPQMAQGLIDALGQQLTQQSTASVGGRVTIVVPGRDDLSGKAPDPLY